MSQQLNGESAAFGAWSAFFMSWSPGLIPPDCHQDGCATWGGHGGPPLRLAVAAGARARDYGKKLVHSGPLYKEMKVEGDAIRISFAHVGGGLASRNGKPLTHFEIAGEDGAFVPAEARIATDGKTILVHADGVENPTQVRFA